MGETFNLIVVEQTEEVEESKLLKDIFPWGVQQVRRESFQVRPA